MPRLDQALLFRKGVVGQIPLQPFRCIVQGFFHFLRRGDDLDRSRQIASGAVGIAVAAGGRKNPPARGRSPPPLFGSPYGGKGGSVKRPAGEGGGGPPLAATRGGP